ncbi:hypothetical protein HDU93_003927 [Gonapodya sp. JEL0774]|nr:hypothetical protein HDU93_003927 [Gonapodya sp. JEL0774]
MDEDFTNNVYLPSVEYLKKILKTETAQIFLSASSGNGSWESVLVNLLSAGDKILIIEGGFFSDLWGFMARNLSLETQVLPTPVRTGLDLDSLRTTLLADPEHTIKAICVVHNETSTGVTLPLGEIRQVIDETAHPALYLVDTISSLASIDFRMDEWKIDGVVCGGQKGLMLPTGLAISAVSPKGWAASATSNLPKHYFNWRFQIQRLPHKSFAGTIPTHMIFALRESLRIIEAEGGVDAVVARHKRLAEGVRRCVAYWGNGGTSTQLEGAPEFFCQDPTRYSDSITAVVIPGEGKPTEVKKACLELGVSLGGAIGKWTQGKVIRIGHLGDNNESSILAILATVETALNITGVPHHAGGVTQAVKYFAEAKKTAKKAAEAAESAEPAQVKTNGHA